MSYKTEIKHNLYDLYAVFGQYKALYDFYWNNQGKIKTEEEIRNRIDYLIKNNKVEQRSEIETLLWVLGEK